MTDPVRLQPGGGAALRGAYTKLLAVSAPAVAFVVVAQVAVPGDHSTVRLVAGVVLGAAAGCLFPALVRGRAAIRGDEAEPAGVRGSTALARVASLAGWLGAIAVAATGFLTDALLPGIVLAAAALILGVCADAAHRIGKRLLTS